MKKGFFIFLFLFFCCLLFSQQFFTSEETNINESWQQLDWNLNKLELTLMRLQSDNALLTETLIEQEKLLSDSRQASAAVLEQYKKSDLALQKSERTLKCWKIAYGTTIAVTVPTIAVLTVVLVIK